jgi:hypothetical protein
LLKKARAGRPGGLLLLRPPCARDRAPARQEPPCADNPTMDWLFEKKWKFDPKQFSLNFLQSRKTLFTSAGILFLTNNESDLFGDSFLYMK